MAVTSPAIRPDTIDVSVWANDPNLYVDRELSLLAFQRRVLEEAQDPANPLLERVKFISILFSNLDEFFMVRVAVLKQKVLPNVPDGPVSEQLDRIRAEVKQLMASAYEIWRELEFALAQAGIELRDYSDLTHRERNAMEA